MTAGTFVSGVDLPAAGLDEERPDECHHLQSVGAVHSRQRVPPGHYCLLRYRADVYRHWQQCPQREVVWNGSGVQWRELLLVRGGRGVRRTGPVRRGEDVVPHWDVDVCERGAEPGQG